MKAAGQKVEKKVINGTEIVTTQYLDGFQYVQDTLRFFPHAEGYVKNTIINGPNPPASNPFKLITFI